MDFGQIYAVNAGVCVLLVATVLLRSLSTPHKELIDRGSVRLFNFFLVFSIEDMLWGVLSSPTVKPLLDFLHIDYRMAYYVFTYGFHLLAAISAFMWFGYLLYYVGMERKKRRLMNVFRGIVLTAQFVSLGSNIFTHFMFHIDENAVYHALWPRKLLFVFQFAYYFVFMIYVLIRLTSEKPERRPLFLSAFVFSVIPLAFGFGQMLFPDVAMYSLGFAFSAVVIYIFNITESRERMLEEKVVTQDRKHTAIINNLMNDYEAIYYIDLATDNYETYCNPAFGKAIPAGDATGHSFFSEVRKWISLLSTEDEASALLGYMNRNTLLEEVRKNGEMRFTCKIVMGGEPEVCEVRAVYTGERNERSKMIVTIRNINEVTMEQRRRAEEMQRLAEDRDTSYRLIHQTLKSGMWQITFSENGSLRGVKWSDEFRKLIGYETEEQFPNTVSAWSDRVHPEDREHVLTEMYETIKDTTGQKTYDVEYRLKVSGGEWRWFHSAGRIARDADGRPVSFVGVFIDVTDENQRRRELENALRQAKSSDEAKTKFLFNMSHDIRTPMNAVLGFADMARKNIDNREKVADCVNKVHTSGQHLLGILNDILDMSRIESGKVTLDRQPMSIPQSFDALMDMVGSLAEEKDIDIRLEKFDVDHETVIADEIHLNRVFMNILTNSIKYTNAGGWLKYSVIERESEMPGCGRYVFRFADNGIGMSKEFLEHVFETFSRERNTTMSGVQGTGLGMAITKSLTDLMGGTIDIESTVGLGTVITLTFDFPIVDEEKKSGRGEIDIASLEGGRVLLVEDNELNREIAADILESVGLIVDTAENGEVAVDKCKNVIRSGHLSEYYDYILMDIQMPVMDGYAATAAIRKLKDPLNTHVPIIAMTANAFSEDKKRSREAGMDAHLSKPIVTDELMRTLCELGGWKK